MDSRASVGKAIVNEVIAAQSRPFETEINRPFPAMIGVGDGRFFKASNKAYELIHRYARLMSDENNDLTTTISHGEIVDLVAQSIASLINCNSSEELLELVDQEIVDALDERLAEKLQAIRFSRKFYYGCAFLRGNSLPDQINIGPASFETRHKWLARLEREQGLSRITARRIRSNWQGKKQRPRTNNQESAIERNLLDAVGRMEIVCTVATGRLSAKAAAPKALLAAQLALTSIALVWVRPSQALRNMALEPDGHFHTRQYAVSKSPGSFGAYYSVTGSQQGQYVDDDWNTAWDKLRSFYQPVEEALYLYTHPECQTKRPKILKSLFMALWWFHEACREQSDLMAIANFASAMDALSGGGRADGIRDIMEHRVGRQADQVWLVSGHTPRQLIKDIYQITRNNVLHGSIKDFDRDYSETRSLAEFMARQCLVVSIDWMHENPEITEIKEIRKA